MPSLLRPTAPLSPIRILTALAVSLWMAAPAAAQVFPESAITTGASDLSPDWSPDGATILFDRLAGGNRDLYTVPAVGGSVTRLTAAAGVDQQGAYSPDGGTVVFSAVVGGAMADLYTRSALSGGPTTLLAADAANTDGFPAWSPDSTLIAYTKGTDIYVIPATGGTPVQITSDPATDTHPAWSPDGNFLAFQSDRSGNFDVWRVPVSGGLPGGPAIQLTTSSGADGSPAWSPDGTRIAYQSDAAGNSDILVIPSDGGGGSLVVTNAATDERQPSWSPDGTDIVFTRASGLWISSLPVADVMVTLSVDNMIPTETDTVTFTVIARNNGPSTADSIGVSLPLPVGLTYLSSMTPAGGYSSVTDLWNLGSLGSGAQTTLDVVATVDPGTAGTVFAVDATRTRGLTADGNMANDADSVPVTVTGLDIAVTKTVDNATPNEGDTVTYTITASNAGPDAATGLTVTDLLDGDLTYVSDTPTAGTYNSGTGVWTVGGLGSGNSATLTLMATVNAGTAGTTIPNAASLTAVDQPDLNSANDADSADVSVRAIDLAVVKTVDDAAPNTGDTVTYTVTVTNAGPDSANGVVVTDALPAGVTFSGDTPSQGTYTSGTGVWDVDVIAPADSATLVITATVDAGTAGQTITNMASVTASDEADLNPADDSDSAGLTVQSADLAVTKTVDDPAPNEGDTVVYTVVVANGGPDAATGVTVLDALPSGVTYVSDFPTTGTYVPGTGIWTLGTLAAAAADTLTITATVDAGTAGTTIQNDASVASADQEDPASGNDTDSASLTVMAVDLAVAKTVDNAMPNENGAVAYTVTVTNAGPDDATGVVLADALPTGVTFTSATPDSGTYDEIGGLWTVGTIAASDSATLVVNVTVDGGTAGTTITNTASLSAVDQTDLDGANDSDSADLTVMSVDLAVTKTVDNAAPDEGDTIVYTVQVNNAGPDAATGVQITDALPAGVTFVSSGGDGSYAADVWTVGTIAAGDSAQLTLTATVDAGQAGNTIINTATRTATDQTDVNGTNDADSASLTVTAIDLAVAKTVDNPAPNENDSVVFTVTVTNNGPDAASGVTLLDSLPAGLTYAADSTSQGTYDDLTGTWTVGSLANAASASLFLTATVDAGTGGQALVNTASVGASDQADTSAANDSDSATVTVQAVDLAVTKTVDDPMPDEGGTINYSVVVSNAGPDAATGVTLTDLLPAGVTYVTDSATSGTYASGSGLWTLGSLAASASDTLSITATVNNGTAGTTITNTASVTSVDQADANGANDADSADVTVTTVDLRIQKSVDVPAPNVGAMISYSVTLTNVGADTATNVQVTDLLPPGVTYVSRAVSQGTYTLGTGLWDVGSVASAGTATLFLNCTVDTASAGDTIVNTAAVTAVDQADSNPANDSASASLTVMSVDLAVAKTVDNATPDENDTVVYTVTVTNNGPDTAGGVEVTDALPAGLTYVTDTTTQGTYASGTGVWTVGTIAVGATDTLTVTATVNPGTATQVINNTASLTASTQVDTNGANDSDSASITVTAIDIAVSKSVDNPMPNEGGTVVYTVTAANSGPDDATNVEITDALPAGVTYESSSGPGSYDDLTGVWTAGTIAAADSAQLLITATVDAGTAGQVVTNIATLTAVDQADANAANDSASADLTVLAVDLAVTKTVDNAAPDEGGTVVYTVALTNLGPDAATGVAVTDLLPAGLTYVSDTVTQGAYAPGTGVWTVGTVAAAGVDTLTITATVNAGTAGNLITNLAAVTAVDQADSTPGNDSDSADLTVTAVDLALAKSVDNAMPNEGATVTWSVVVSNAGPDAATGVVVTDILPAGVTFVSAAATQGTYDSGTALWTVGAVGAGAADTLDITTTVDAGTGGQTLTNQADVTASDQADTNAANDSASAALTVMAVDLAVTKTVDNATPNEGDPVVYTIALTNLGPDAATGVVVTDLLPASVTFAGATTTQGTYVPGTGVWTVGTVAAAGVDTLKITATVNAGTAGTVIPNTAAVTAVDQADGVPGNDSDSADLTVTAVDIAVTKTVDDAAPTEGGTVVYTVTAANAGPDVATGVTVTDLLPTGVTYVSDVPTQGSYVPGTGLWTVGTLAVGAADTLTVTATVDAGTGGSTLVNQAARSGSDQADTNAGNDADSAAVTVTAIDIALAKSVDNASPNEGDSVIWTIVATNGGPDDATGIQIADTLPAGVTYVSSTVTSGAFNPGTGVWDLPALAAGTSDTLTVTTSVNGGTAGVVFTNVVAVTATDQVDSNPGNDTASADITVASVDLAVTKSVDNASPNEGGTVVYEVVVANGGPDGATGVVVTDVLPAGVTFVSAVTTSGTYADGTGIWTVGSVAAAAADTLTLTATVNAGTASTTITNTASLTASDQTDVNAANDSDSADITVTVVDIQVDKTVNIPSPGEGATIVYTVTATNVGADDATGVQITDVLPTGVTFDSAVPSGAYNDTTGIWNVGSLASAASKNLFITAVVDSGTAGQTLTNTAMLTAVDQADDNASNDSDSAAVTVRSVDLAVAKTVDDPSPAEGATITYTVVVTNGGPDAATGVAITDLLPAGVTYVSDIVTTGSYDEVSGVWTVGGMAAAVSDTLSITATVDAGTAGTTISNMASVTAVDQGDPNGANDSATADLTVSSADIAVSKAVDDALPEEGATVVYTVVAANGGPDNATGVELTDVLPAGVTFVMFQSTQGGYNDLTGVWSVGAMPAGSADTLSITVTVDAGTATMSIDNTATLTAIDQTDPNAANDADTAGLTVSSTDIAVVKTVDDAMPDEGDTVLFTVAVSNAGPGDGTGLQVTDLLPAGLTLAADSTTAGTYNPGTGVWDLGGLAAGIADTLFISAVVDSGTAGQMITNTAFVSALQTVDPNAANDTSSVSLGVSSADLSLTKTVDAATGNPGDIRTFTITVSNAGPNGATGVEVTDLLPTGLTFAADSTTQGTYSGGTGIWTVGPIDSAGQATLFLRATVDSAAVGQLLTNVATISASDQADPVLANGTDSASVDVPLVEVSLIKFGDRTETSEGGTVTYTITVVNTGADDATGVEITDVLPAGLTYQESMADRGTYDPGTGLWDLGTVGGAAGDIVNLYITVTVDDGTGGTVITNTATLTGLNEADADPANNSYSAPLVVFVATPAPVPTFIPTTYDLAPGRPNPFRETATLQFDMPQAGMARLVVFDVKGRIVRNLIHQEMPAGRHTVQWDGRDERGSRIATGVYFVRMQAGTYSDVRKIVRLN